MAKAYPSTNEFKAGIAGAYDPLGILLRPQLRIIQTVGLTLTGMVLLVVSLNISGMMQVRGAMRERELSIRQAIGASRLRLAQYLLSESIVLACAGGALASIVLFNIPSLLPWLTDDPEEAVAGADCVVTDTWVSMGQQGESGRRKQLLGPYAVDGKLMRKAASGAIFMHCLPAYRGNEVSAAVIDGPQSAVWDEAENRLHAQKAILAWCLGVD